MGLSVWERRWYRTHSQYGIIESEQTNCTSYFTQTLREFYQGWNSPFLGTLGVLIGGESGHSILDLSWILALILLWVITELRWHVCAQLCPTLCNSKDCSPPGSSVHGIFQERQLEWVAISYSRGSSWPRGLLHASPALASRFFPMALSGRPIS